jgi:CBS domain-containing protein
LDELKVRDIMRTDVITVGPDATVKELAGLLSEHKISGVPVVDADGSLLGIVSEGDVIVQDADLHFPHYVQFLESTIYLGSMKKFDERFKKAFGAKVSDVMSEDVQTVGPDDTVHAVATLMSDHDINRVPVVEDGKVVGIVTRGDIVRAIAGGEA